MAYPVIAEVLLPPAARTWYGRRRREPTDVPLARPGCAYVFKAHGEFVPYDAQRLDFGDDIVVSATAVYLVDIRPRRLPVDITIPSAFPDEDFTVRATFRCRVTDPAAAAEASLVDLDVLLASHLASDDMLGSAGRRADVGRAHLVRRLADARVRALCTVAPPEAPGVEISLVQVDVLVADPAPPGSAAPPRRAPDDLSRVERIGGGRVD